MSSSQPGVHPALIGIIIICSIVIFGLIKNAVGLYQSGSRLQATLDIEAERSQYYQQLQQEALLQSDPVAYDQQIRSKLNLIKPGDIPLIIESTPPPVATSSPTPTPALAPFHQWLDVFNL